MVAQDKFALVQKIHDLLLKKPNFVLIKIGKTNHQTLEALRKELKKNQSVFKVIKNRLFAKAVNKMATDNQNFVDLRKTFLPLKETNALLLFEKEWSNGLRTFYQFSKKEASLSFQFGLLDDKSYIDKELLGIAQLPAKNQLIANLIGSFKSPSSRLVYSLKFNLTKLVYILKEKSKRTN